MKYFICILLIQFTMFSQSRAVKITYEEENMIELEYNRSRVDYIILGDVKTHNMNKTEKREFEKDTFKLYKTYKLRSYKNDSTYSLKVWVTRLRGIFVLETI